MTTVDEIPPALEQLDPQKLLAFKKGGKAQVAFTKATNDLISELFSCFSALGKTSILLVLEDGEYNGKVFSPDFEVFAGALDSQVGQILKRCIRTAGNAPEEKLFSTKTLKKYAKQLKVLYGLPSDGLHSDNISIGAMNKTKILFLLKRYYDAGFRIDSKLLRFLERVNVITKSCSSNKKASSLPASSQVKKFWNPRLKNFEIKVYVEGREDRRSTRGKRSAPAAAAAEGSPAALLPHPDGKKQKCSGSSSITARGVVDRDEGGLNELGVNVV